MKHAKKRDETLHVHQNSKVNFDFKIDLKFTLTPKQQEFVDLVLNKNTKIVLVKGPPGTAKSYLAIYCALKLLQEKKIGDIYYIRQPVESSSFNIGFLKGEAKSKLEPYMSVLVDKLNEFLLDSTIKHLEKEERIKTNTPGFMRGASINNSFIFNDESQNYLVKDFLLMITRMGKFGKQVFAGDIRQSDIKNSGFEIVYKLLDCDEARKEGIFTFKFGREDIVRERFISFILDKFESLEDKK